MQTILETERLLLRLFDVGDAAFMLKLVNDPDWLRYIGDRKVYTLESAEQYLLHGSLRSYETHGFGFYAVALRETNDLIGTCGFAQRDFLDTPDFGFAFLPEYTRKGYAFEIAEAALEYARTGLKIRSLSAITLPENIRSVHLLKKLGFQFDRILEDKGEALQLYRFP